ncbi:uncharacterized protein BomT1 [Drosophila kikkawai]|uniref:Uncharacterized protein BomT1 n=1 Tax=Drosophila kikkawai TaxID=30033 RepID=A0A6P4IRJ0_DROKI|nr:uncharacterized protein LOC108076666 [Drosophila kikkawai]
MKYLSLFVTLLALLCLTDFGSAGRIHIPKITIRNGDITVHGDCIGCTARASKNSAHLSIHQSYSYKWRSKG